MIKLISKTCANALPSRISIVSMFACLTTLALVGCSLFDPDIDEALAGNHTTCLKRGLAADTKEHVDCVLALRREKQQRQTELRDAVEPKPSSDGVAGATPVSQ